MGGRRERLRREREPLGELFLLFGFVGLPSVGGVGDGGVVEIGS
jgi:hypothetical protein